MPTHPMREPDRAEAEFRGCRIRRERNIVDVTDFHQCLNVRVVGVCGEGIAQEDDEVKELFGDECPDIRQRTSRSKRSLSRLPVVAVATRSLARSTSRWRSTSSLMTLFAPS